MEGLKPYPKMKDSGVPWLGRVPEHWNIVPMCSIARERKRIGFQHEELLSVYLGRGVIRFSESAERRTNPTSDDLSNYQLVEPGDFVLNNQQAWRGSVGVSQHRGIVSPAYLILELSNQLDRGFANRLLTDRSMVAQYLVSSKGVGSIQRNLYWPHLRRTLAVVPPPAEQASAVHFLTHADRRIRRLIRSKQKLITLLDQQKQAIIHRAVTRGLDPHVRLKPSGVPWLGDIPEHWEVRRSKRLFAPRKELARPGDVQLAATQAFGVIAQDDYEKLVGRRIVKIFRHLEKRRHVEIGDFVISMRSFQGGLERAWQTGCIRSSYVVLRPMEAVDVGYFSRVFKSSGYIRALQSTADFIRDGQDLNYDNFCSVDVAFPPIAEQVAISRMLDAALRRTTTLSERTSQEVLVLKELRTRLISDVVTGKLDVRDAAARLPAEDLEGDEPDDDTDTSTDSEEDDDSVVEDGTEEGDGA
jgi:type I restriction enzyme S subunit